MKTKFDSPFVPITQKRQYNLYNQEPLHKFKKIKMNQMIAVIHKDLK